MAFRIISIPSLAISSLLESSLDMIARIPKQVFIASAWEEFRSIRFKISGTLLKGKTDDEVVTVVNIFFCLCLVCYSRVSF